MNFKQTAGLLLGGLVLAAGMSSLYDNFANKNNIQPTKPSIEQEIKIAEKNLENKVPTIKQGTTKSAQVNKVIKDVSIVVINGKEIKINGLKGYNEELIDKLYKIVDETNDVKKLQNLKNHLDAFIPNLADVKVIHKDTLNQIKEFLRGLDNLSQYISQRIAELQIGPKIDKIKSSIKSYKDYNMKVIQELNELLDQTNDVEQLKVLQRRLVSDFVPLVPFEVVKDNPQLEKQLSEYTNALDRNHGGLDYRISAKIQLLQSQMDNSPTLN